MSPENRPKDQPENHFDQNRLREWLRQGWILERRSLVETVSEARESGDSGDFLIGGGPITTLGPGGLERASCAVWAPDFFTDFSQVLSGDSKRPYLSQWTRVIRRNELLAWLSNSSLKTAFEKNEISVPSAKVSWEPPNEECFRRAFDRIGHAFREEHVKKAVPVVFSRGRVAMSDRLFWIRDRIIAGIQATDFNDLRLYGSWSDDAGFLGATPEDLFTRRAGVVTSMAVAGTRALSSLGDQSEDPDALAKFAHDFLNDPKERVEHDLVIQDIDRVLGGAEKSATRVDRFGSLFHLVTNLTQRSTTGLATDSMSSSTIETLVSGLHPTPALGVSPRESSMKLLKELHRICGEGVEREGFGAPFVVKFQDEVHAIVAIRQIRWKFDETDRAEIVVGSGCGVVPESRVENEWKELAAKRQAVMRLFRLSTEKSEPVFWSLQILQNLLRIGVRRFIVCAGARNAPLVVAAEALSQSGRVKIESFFEERAAAFYALGLARSRGEPVAILTTSGTAVSELLPAMTEADFSGVPIIAVTADRPRRLRHSGAPQTIPQTRIFADVAERVWDLEEGDSIDRLDLVSKTRPLHLNICLEEPLLADAEAEPDRLFENARKDVHPFQFTASTSISIEEADSSLALAALGSFLARDEGQVAVVGALGRDERDAVASFLVSHGLPALLEGPSGLRGDRRLRDIELRGGDRDLQRMCREGNIGGVIRIGGIPTTRVWRDLDDVLVRTQTLSISRLRFSGLGRGGFIHLPGPAGGTIALSDFLKKASVGPGLGPARLKAMHRDSVALLEADRRTAMKVDAAIGAHPQSEPAFVRALSHLVSNDSLVYVGNSLPIRWWDLAATRESVFALEANRGVNGIDGQLSTALGLVAGTESGSGAESYSEAWILLGDLTALYDLAAPWALRRELSRMAKPPKVRIVILNNSGGRIFNRVLANAPGGPSPFENEHGLGFEAWAKMWDLDYALISDADELARAHSSSKTNAVFEIIPKADDTAGFWKASETVETKDSK